MGVAFDQLQDLKTELVRKTIGMSVFMAPYSSSGIATLTDTDKNLLALPAGYEDIGLMTTDGIQYSSEVNISEVRSAGKVEASRSDITSDQTSIEIGCQETKLRTIALYTGADETGITPNPTTGEVSIAKPARPKIRHWRMLAIGMDDSDAGEIYIARYFPRVRVGERGEQTYQSEEDEALLWSVTLNASVDSVAGYSERYLFGGPGWFALLNQMGF